MSQIQHGLTKSEYLRFREPYLPTPCKVIFVFESPPNTGKYFYKREKIDGEQLFYAMMKQILGIKPGTKDEGLRAFADGGYLLLDATYTPVNGLPEGRVRDKIIEDDFPLLIEELNKYAGPNTKVIVVKKNVCNLLVQKLKHLKQFQVLNADKIVPYPGCGQQTKFGNMVRPMLGLEPLY
jgi:hypothetical protein